jgi:hypothetical protein
MGNRYSPLQLSFNQALSCALSTHRSKMRLFIRHAQPTTYNKKQDLLLRISNSPPNPPQTQKIQPEGL